MTECETDLGCRNQRVQVKFKASPHSDEKKPQGLDILDKKMINLKRCHYSLFMLGNLSYPQAISAGWLFAS